MSLHRAATHLYLETDRNSQERELGRDRQGEKNPGVKWPPQDHNLCSESGCLGDKSILLAAAGAKSGALLFLYSELHIIEKG